MTMRLSSGILILAVLLSGSVTMAQWDEGERPAAPAERQRIVLHITPQAPARPAMRYSLRTTVADERAGNAVLQWSMLMQRLPDDDVISSTQMSEWLKTAPGNLPVEAVEAALNRHFSDEFWSQVALAAAHREADWGTQLREQGMHAVLPHLNQARRLGQAIALRARLQMEQGDFHAAVVSLQHGIELANDVPGEPVLVEALVAMGIRQLMLDQVRIMQQTADAPNLYWALADLPSFAPVIYESMRMERSMLHFTFPSLERLEAGTFSRDDYSRLLTDLSALSGLDTTEREQMLAAATDEQAKQLLLAHGYTRERVDAMAAHEMAARYMMISYERGFDEKLKWLALPPWQGVEGLQRAETAFDLRRREKQTDLFSIFLMPSMRAAWARGAEAQRAQAVAQLIEALRAHAAAADGHLPARLEALDSTPAPLDPVTGKPFIYEMVEQTAVIESPGALEDRLHPLRLEIQMQPTQ